MSCWSFLLLFSVHIILFLWVNGAEATPIKDQLLLRQTRKPSTSPQQNFPTGTPQPATRSARSSAPLVDRADLANRATTPWANYPPLVLTVDPDFRPLSHKTMPTKPQLQPEPRLPIATPMAEAMEPKITTDTMRSPMLAVPPDTAPPKHPRTRLFVAAILSPLLTMGIWYGLGQRHTRRKPPQQDADHDFSRLPCLPLPLVGRRSLLRQLQEHLADPEVAVVAIIGPAGVGKSALVSGWLDTIQPDYGGACKVFGWSFHNQSGALPHSHSGLFFSAALTFFGHEGEWPASEERRAKRLGELLQQQPSLLILDGIEPLQHAITTNLAQQAGSCYDPGLYRLLRLLRAKGTQKTHKNSLVVLTSRYPLFELTDTAPVQSPNHPTGPSNEQRIPCAGYREIQLHNLTVKEGVQFLRQQGVSRKLLPRPSTTVHALRGHALGLLLLGRLLVHTGQTQKNAKQNAKRPPSSLWTPGESGEHVERILAYYAQEIWPKESPHGCLLRLSGLFDRAMTEADWQILRADASLAQPLQPLDSATLTPVLDDVQRSGLLQWSATNRYWQSHPMVQEYFRRQLLADTTTDQVTHNSDTLSAPAVADADKPDAPAPATHIPQQTNHFIQAQYVLFNYFQVFAGKKQPDTQEGLDALYRAVWHGCQAGQYRDALHTVLTQRIHRGSDRFSQTTMGAYSADVAALSGFFPNGWAEPPATDGLRLEDRIWLLAETTHGLTTLGRLPEALQTMEEGLRTETQRGARQSIPTAAATLCDLQLANGRLQQALATAEYGLRWAEQSGIYFLQGLLQTKRATALHRLGEWSASHLIFQQVEAMQAEKQPDQPWLPGLAGKEYIDLLLEQQLVTPSELLQRAEAIWQQAVKKQSHALIALGLLAKGRILALMDDDEQAQTLLNAAITTLEKGENGPIMAEILLHRATFMRRQREPDAAWQDLEEGLEMAQRCGLVLLKVDGTLLAGHMLLDQNRRSAAEAVLLQAEALIAQLEYGQRRASAMALRSRCSGPPETLDLFSTVACE